MWHAGNLPLFFFNDTPTTEIYTLSLTTLFRSALADAAVGNHVVTRLQPLLLLIDSTQVVRTLEGTDRKSTRLNSSHSQISYAVFCLKKKKKTCINICQLLTAQ